MRALPIRHPYAELILRGIKADFGELSRAVELRSLGGVSPFRKQPVDETLVTCQSS